MAIGKCVITIDFFQTGQVCMLNNADDHPRFCGTAETLHIPLR